MLRKIVLCAAAAALLSFFAPETRAQVLSPQEIQKIMSQVRDSEEFPYKARIKGTNVNMRSTFSTKGKKVGQISNGEVFVYEAEQNENEQFPWFHCVSLADGNEGWMYGQFVTTSWPENYPHASKHKFFALLKLELPLDKQGRPVGLGKTISTEKLDIPDFKMTYWTYVYENAKVEVAQSGNKFFVKRATVSAPGRGFGGLYCETVWCDQFYVDKHLEGLIKDQRGEDNNVWHYDASESEHFELFVTFGDDALVKKIEYVSYID